MKTETCFSVITAEKSKYNMIRVVIAQCASQCTNTQGYIYIPFYNNNNPGAREIRSGTLDFHAAKPGLIPNIKY